MLQDNVTSHAMKLSVNGAAFTDYLRERAVNNHNIDSLPKR